MKESILMRILFCNIHCPILCFCKPSAAAAAALYAATASASGPLQPPTQASPCRVVSVSDSSDQSFDDAKDDDNGGLKSCIKKKKKKISPAEAPAASEEETTERKKVQWVDEVGQELAEILEFESSECGDMDYEEGNRSGCVCTIL